MKLTTYFHLVPRSRIRGAIPPLVLYVFMAWCSVKAQGQLYCTLLYFTLLYISNIVYTACNRLFINNEFVRTGKEAVCFKVESKQLRGGTDENYRTAQSCLSVSGEPETLRIGNSRNGNLPRSYESYVVKLV
jgi:hypothetical protein